MSDGTKLWTSDEFQLAFWTAKRAMADATDLAYRRYGVRGGQQFILKALWHEDGLSPGELARRLGLATPTVTKATCRMEAAGLVTRDADPADRRLVRIRLTDRGRELRGTLDREMRALSERAMRTFTDQERLQLVDMLARLRRNLSEPGPADAADTAGDLPDQHADAGGPDDLPGLFTAVGVCAPADPCQAEPDDPTAPCDAGPEAAGAEGAGPVSVPPAPTGG